MEIKKSNIANNENLRFPIALMAFLFVGGLLLASFTYETMSSQEADIAKVEKGTDIKYSEDVKKEETPEPITPPEQVVPPQPIIRIDSNRIDPPVTTVAPPPPPIVVTGQPLPPIPKAAVIPFPDVEARFPGGTVELQSWIVSNVVYPELSITMGDQGKVYLSFIVEVDGSITGVSVDKNISKELDREAKRLIRNMPSWIPGEVAGKRVRTKCRLPVVFTLE